MKTAIEIIEEYLEVPGNPALAYVARYERGLLKAIINSIRKEEDENERIKCDSSD